MTILFLTNEDHLAGFDLKTADQRVIALTKGGGHKVIGDLCINYNINLMSADEKRLDDFFCLISKQAKTLPPK
ncbi:hypothetical protein P7F88_11025 [Vibrio hannami]|nr:hypothetical protein [Vibrio hannami]MDG3086615.1 hypothetical protein [Vibrio hannami]